MNCLRRRFNLFLWNSFLIVANVFVCKNLLVTRCFCYSALKRWLVRGENARGRAVAPCFIFPHPHSDKATPPVLRLADCIPPPGIQLADTSLSRVVLLDWLVVSRLQGHYWLVVYTNIYVNELSLARGAWLVLIQLVIHCLQLSRQ